MQQNPSPADIDDANDDGLTAAERAELANDTETGGAPTGAAATAATPDPAPTEPAPEPAPTDPAPAQPDATAQALLQLAETQKATAEALARVSTQAQPAEAAPPAAATPVEPDWEAERKALRGKYDEGELNDAEYETEREKLLERKSEWRTEQRVAEALAKDAKARAEEAERLAGEARDNEWAAAEKAFAGAAANGVITGDPDRMAVFNTMLQRVHDENPNARYDDMFKTAVERTRKACNLPEPTVADEKRQVQQANNARREVQAPPDLSRAPQAGGADDRVGSEYGDLDSMDIDSLENRLAKMSDAEQARFLETAPGGLLDNPRQQA